MAGFMAPLNNYTYAALRIVTGLLFLFHGSQKLLGWPVEPMAESSRICHLRCGIH